MTDILFQYSVRSAFVLALLYIPYMLMLRRESFFRLNRAVLLSILLFSLVLPVLDIHQLAWGGLAPVQTAFQPLSREGGAPATDGLWSEMVVASASDAPLRAWIWQWVSVFFVLVTCVVALFRLYQMARMGVEIRRGSLWRQTHDGMHVYCHADEVSPYSWMNSVVISERDYLENGREILLHERAHIRARHSLDLIFLIAVQTLQWWNPLVYILGVSLRDVHEYQADDSVLRHGVSARSYQLLLIKKVVGSSSYAFANNFDHSLIVKRITMMQKSKPRKWACSKVLYVLPMATLALSAFATVRPSVTHPVKDSEGKVSAFPPNAQVNVQEKAALSPQLADILKTPVDYCATPSVYPEFPGGELEMLKFFQNNLRYPAKAKEQGVQGRVMVEFFVTKEGSVDHVCPVRWIDANDKKPSAENKVAYEEGVKAILEEAVRVVESMPRWTPGYEDKAKTKPCVARFVIPMCFI